MGRMFQKVIRRLPQESPLLSIEHEDGLMSPMEGLRKAMECLKQVVISEDAGEMFWARD
jgi:hypothetical protein